VRFGEGFKLDLKTCCFCKKKDERWKDRTYRLLRLNQNDLAHPWCLIKEHGEARAQELVPPDEWAKRASA
jgi:hypothetical protein